MAISKIDQDGIELSSLNVDGTVTADGLTIDGGTTNRVASFISTDANALIEFADDTTTNRPAIGAEGNDMTFSTNGEQVRIDSSGNVGIGSTSLVNKLTVNGNQVLLANGELKFADSANSQVATIKNNGGSGTSQLQFLTANTERMRIDSNGSWMVGTTSSTNTPSTTGGTQGIQWDRSGRPVLLAQSHDSGAVIKVNQTFNDTSNRGAIRFYRTGTEVGSIFCSPSATSYNTSSDYRLKEDWVPMEQSIERVKALKPVNFAWKADGTRVDGFLAHEAQEVVPEAVSGEKDGMRTEEYEVTPAVLDEDGNVVTEAVMGEREVPDYQGIDQSKLVPLLTAALQEAIGRIEILEAEVATLKEAN